ncbi:hypothetical protein CsatB_011649 [Cannabis sativa]|uniref:Uncharacterized protein n=1 Tax=Cannabis sativa TaxID=3483 RepID=A0A803NXA3_CANSA
MVLQSICLGFSPPKLGVPSRGVSNVSGKDVGFRNQRLLFGTTPRCSKRFEKLTSLPSFKKGGFVCKCNAKLENSGNENSRLPIVRYEGVEPFRGKSGSVSFHGLTHQLVEESKLVSAPFNEEKGSFLWVLAPLAIISSLILPQFFGGAIEAFLKEDILVEIVSSLVFEAAFYIGVAIFLLVTHHVQRPYLQFSPKRWGLITGLRGYLTTSFFTMGFKVMAPMFAVYVTWPVIGFPALVAVLPFLVGCAAQYVFELSLDKRGSSCWPLVPIIFEVYRLYQLTRATFFIEKLLFALKDIPLGSPEVMERSGALFSMVVTFQVLGLVCLWSLMAFLLRLFPSRPVAEKY